TGRTSLPDTKFPKGQRNVSIGDDHILSCGFETIEERSHDCAAVVHIRLWQDQYRGLPAQRRYGGNQGWTIAFLDLNVLTFGDPLENTKASIMIRAGVFFARIAQPNDEPHQKNGAPMDGLSAIRRAEPANR